MKSSKTGQNTAPKTNADRTSFEFKIESDASLPLVDRMNSLLAKITEEEKKIIDDNHHLATYKAHLNAIKAEIEDSNSQETYKKELAQINEKIKSITSLLIKRNTKSKMKRWAEGEVFDFFALNDEIDHQEMIKDEKESEQVSERSERQAVASKEIPIAKKEHKSLTSRRFAVNTIAYLAKKYINEINKSEILDLRESSVLEAYFVEALSKVKSMNTVKLNDASAKEIMNIFNKGPTSYHISKENAFKILALLSIYSSATEYLQCNTKKDQIQAWENIQNKIDFAANDLNTNNSKYRSFLTEPKRYVDTLTAISVAGHIYISDAAIEAVKMTLSSDDSSTKSYIDELISRQAKYKTLFQNHESEAGSLLENYSESEMKLENSGISEDNIKKIASLDKGTRTQTLHALHDHSSLTYAEIVKIISNQFPDKNDKEKLAIIKELNEIYEPHLLVDDKESLDISTGLLLKESIHSIETINEIERILNDLTALRETKRLLNKNDSTIQKIDDLIHSMEKPLVIASTRLLSSINEENVNDEAQEQNKKLLKHIIRTLCRNNLSISTLIGDAAGKNVATCRVILKTISDDKLTKEEFFKQLNYVQIERDGIQEACHYCFDLSDDPINMTQQKPFARAILMHKNVNTLSVDDLIRLASYLPIEDSMELITDNRAIDSSKKSPILKALADAKEFKEELTFDPDSFSKSAKNIEEKIREFLNKKISPDLLRMKLGASNESRILNKITQVLNSLKDTPIPFEEYEDKNNIQAIRDILSALILINSNEISPVIETIIKLSNPDLELEIFDHLPTNIKSDYAKRYLTLVNSATKLSSTHLSNYMNALLENESDFSRAFEIFYRTDDNKLKHQSLASVIISNSQIREWLLKHPVEFQSALQSVVSKLDSDKPDPHLLDLFSHWSKEDLEKAMSLSKPEDQWLISLAMLKNNPKEWDAYLNKLDISKLTPNQILLIPKNIRIAYLKHLGPWENGLRVLGGSPFSAIQLKGMASHLTSDLTQDDVTNLLCQPDENGNLYETALMLSFSKDNMNAVISFVASGEPSKANKKKLGWLLINELEKGIWNKTDNSDLHTELNRENAGNYVARKVVQGTLFALYAAMDSLLGAIGKPATEGSAPIADDSYRNRLMIAILYELIEGADLYTPEMNELIELECITNSTYFFQHASLSAIKIALKNPNILQGLFERVELVAVMQEVTKSGLLPSDLSDIIDALETAQLERNRDASKPVAMLLYAFPMSLSTYLDNTATHFRPDKADKDKKAIIKLYHQYSSFDFPTTTQEHYSDYNQNKFLILLKNKYDSTKPNADLISSVMSDITFSNENLLKSFLQQQEKYVPEDSTAKKWIKRILRGAMMGIGVFLVAKLVGFLLPNITGAFLSSGFLGPLAGLAIGGAAATAGVATGIAIAPILAALAVSATIGAVVYSLVAERTERIANKLRGTSSQDLLDYEVLKKGIMNIDNNNMWIPIFTNSDMRDNFAKTITYHKNRGRDITKVSNISPTIINFIEAATGDCYHKHQSRIWKIIGSLAEARNKMILHRAERTALNEKSQMNLPDQEANFTTAFAQIRNEPLPADAKLNRAPSSRLITAELKQKSQSSVASYDSTPDAVASPRTSGRLPTSSLSEPKQTISKKRAATREHSTQRSKPRNSV